MNKSVAPLRANQEVYPVKDFGRKGKENLDSLIGRALKDLETPLVSQSCMERAPSLSPRTSVKDGGVVVMSSLHHTSPSSSGFSA